jgi:hypothetical protein
MDESTRSYKGAKITGKQNPSQVLSIKESSWNGNGIKGIKMSSTANGKHLPLPGLNTLSPPPLLLCLSFCN